jgi:hypothetical protein
LRWRNESHNTESGCRTSNRRLLHDTPLFGHRQVTS